jgi:hypothetical protein
MTLRIQGGGGGGGGGVAYGGGRADFGEWSRAGKSLEARTTHISRAANAAGAVIFQVPVGAGRGTSGGLR